MNESPASSNRLLRTFSIVSGCCTNERLFLRALIRLRIRVRTLAVLGIILGLLGCDDGASVGHMRGADESFESPRVQPAEGGTIESMDESIPTAEPMDAQLI